MQLTPAPALVRGLVLVNLPLPLSEYLQAGRVDDEVKRVIVPPGEARHLDITIAPRERRVVGRLEGEAHRADQ